MQSSSSIYFFSLAFFFGGTCFDTHSLTHPLSSPRPHDNRIPNDLSLPFISMIKYAYDIMHRSGSAVKAETYKKMCIRFLVCYKRLGGHRFVPTTNWMRWEPVCCIFFLLCQVLWNELDLTTPTYCVDIKGAFQSFILSWSLQSITSKAVSNPEGFCRSSTFHLALCESVRAFFMLYVSSPLSPFCTGLYPKTILITVAAAKYDFFIVHHVICSYFRWPQRGRQLLWPEKLFQVSIELDFLSFHEKFSLHLWA